MARPKLGETDTERMQLKITSAEIEAIDTWRFANRVPSRSEAVRRLCQIGLLVSDELEGLTDSTSELSSAMRQLNGETFKLWAQVISPVWKGETLDRAAVASVLKTLVSDVSQVDAGVDDVSSVLVGLFMAVAGIARAGNIAEGKAVADKAIKETNENLSKMRELRGRMEENRRDLGEIDFSDSWKTESDDK
ncbi:hypothetical protein [Sinorhizobium medicae]|uniref:hypothetical protein n=1 Tax=Sinorhizobium medicae TaxID=110321 RepID=UPI000C7C126F|nr:hypothetical protein [Sinorhizobium medicae]MDX0512738.1 hypothetical protein [Sinorhizobium medicae]MDX0937382.1 hypothetical protein [Sinorhizobium medicae]MDX0943511.1 hypothetical protein [Sinorhizobium medicae]MDX0949009.1 hypothetical protein [Sinorhizobium medicae]MDX1010699.1 hypothetical protein [Sinorhizobium medicae]